MLALDTNAHSVFLMYYHLVLVTKYRHEVIDKAVSDRAKEIFEYIAPTYKITVEEWNYATDHIHVLFKAHPKTELSKFINAYKSASSRLIKRDFPEIVNKLWREFFWSRSFCIITTGGVTRVQLVELYDVIKSYIESQGLKSE
jgi:putative transposase